MALFVTSDLLTTMEYVKGIELGIGVILTIPIWTFFLATLYHPTMESLTDAPPDHEPRLGAGRFVLLGIAQLIPPVFLTLQAARVASMSKTFLVGAAFVMTALVLARLTLLIRNRDSLLNRGEALRAVAERLSEEADLNKIYEIGVNNVKSVCDSAKVAGTAILEQRGRPDACSGIRWSRMGSDALGEIERWVVEGESGAVRLDERSDAGARRHACVRARRRPGATSDGPHRADLRRT